MEPEKDEALGDKANDWTDGAIRLAMVAFIIFWSFLLLQPFIAILVWAAILSVALFPTYVWLKRILGGRAALASFLLTVLLLIVLLGPFSTIGGALVKNLSGIATDISAGRVSVPPPPAFVAEWPIIGGKVSAYWQTAFEELDKALVSIAPQLQVAAKKTMGVLGSIGISILQFAVAIIVAGFIYSRAASLEEHLRKFAVRAAPRRGWEFIDLAEGVVRGVARGVVGISLVQSILFGIGAIAAEIPLAGLLTFAVLLFAIVQIGPAIVIVPVIIFAWSTMDTLGATVLSVYLVPVMLMDNVLKPIVMGHGLPVPMLVIFIGVIGGTIAHGLIGLFVGPIVLALSYELGRAWITVGEE